MTKKIDEDEAEANRVARRKELAEHSLRGILDVEDIEIIRRRNLPEDDVPPDVVLEAFRQDFPPLPFEPDDPETYVPLEGSNLKLTDATQIVGDLTMEYDIEHRDRQHALSIVKNKLGEVQRGGKAIQWDKGRPCVAVYGRLNLHDLIWLHKSDPRIVGVKKDYEGEPTSSYDCPNLVYYTEPSTWPEADNAHLSPPKG